MNIGIEKDNVCVINKSKIDMLNSEVKNKIQKKKLR